MSTPVPEIKPSWYAPEIIGRSPLATNQLLSTGDKANQTGGDEKKDTQSSGFTTKWGNQATHTWGTNSVMIGGANSSLVMGNVANIVAGSKEDIHLLAKADMTLGPVLNTNLSTTTKYVLAKDVTYGPQKDEKFIFMGITCIKKQINVVGEEVVAVQQNNIIVNGNENVVNRNSQVASERRSGSIIDQIIAVDNRSSIVSNVRSSLFQSFVDLEVHV